MNITEGAVVKSEAGHDKDMVYFVKKCENGFAFLVNGKTKKHGNPKQKKLKHLSRLDHDGVDGIDNLSDKKIRRLLREIAEKSV